MGKKERQKEDIERNIGESKTKIKGQRILQEKMTLKEKNFKNQIQRKKKKKSLHMTGREKRKNKQRKNKFKRQNKRKILEKKERKTKEGNQDKKYEEENERLISKGPQMKGRKKEINNKIYF